MSVVFTSEIKQTVETKECEIIEGEFKGNISVISSCIRQSGIEVCKSINEAGDSIYDREENENKQCQNNSVRFFQVTKTKRNGQCSVFAHAENCKPNSRNGKSKKHREEKKFIDDEYLENKVKKNSFIRSAVNEISEVTATDGIDVHGDEKCDDIVVAYHKTTPIKMESNIVITIDDSDDEDIGKRSKLFAETGEVIAKDEDDGDGAVRRYKARSTKMESKTLITIDENDDSKSKDDIDIIIVDEDNEYGLGSRARTTIEMKTEEDLNISDVKLEVIKLEEVPEMKVFKVPEKFIIKEDNNRKPGLSETSYHTTDRKEHDITIIKVPVEGIKVERKDSLEWPNNNDSLPEEVSNPLCPFQYPDLSKDVKAGEYYQVTGSSEVIEDSPDSRLIIDEIKEENQTDLSFEPGYDSCSSSCKTPTPDLEHTTAVLGNKAEFSSFNTETEMMTEEDEGLEFCKCLSSKEESNRVRCYTCKKSFPSQRVLAKHILKHTGGKVFRCDECHMQFILMSQLTAHKDKKHLKTFYNCKHCGVSFNTRSKLMSHVSVHTGERPYCCGGCGDMFISNSDLVEHRLKSGEQPFYCEKCGARFPWKSMLRVHQKVHGEIKKCNVCPVCSQAFRYSVLLLMHQISAGHGIPYWYEDGLNALNPKRQQQHGRIKLCFHMLKVAPRRVCGRLRILGKQNAAQMTSQQISKKEKQMDVEEETSSATEIKGGMLSLEGAKGPKEMSTSKELNEGGCYKRIYIKSTQKP